MPGRSREARQHRAELRRLEPIGGTCDVPGCEELKIIEDVGYKHALAGAGSHYLPNEGIIDWEAVRIAAKGERAVKLTWVEAEIAAGMALLDGATLKEVHERLGIPYKPSPEQTRAYQKMRDAIEAVA